MHCEILQYCSMQLARSLVILSKYTVKDRAQQQVNGQLYNFDVNDMLMPDGAQGESETQSRPVEVGLTSKA